MKKRLLTTALVSYLMGALAVGLLVFLPAGTLRYPAGWLFCALLFIPMLVLGVALWLKAPALLEKRLNRREAEAEQRKVIGATVLMFLAGFILNGLDFRFTWSRMPGWVTVIASLVFLFSYGLYAEVMRENAYLSRTVEVQQGQRVIDTGLYGVVRHPMYAASVLMFGSMPLVLGSWVALPVFLIYPFLMVRRIRNEEAVLEAGLADYSEYKKKVRWRLIPLIW